MNLAQLIAMLLSGGKPTNQNRVDAGISVLPQTGEIQQTGNILDLRRKMMNAYRMGDYNTAAQLKDMIARMQNAPTGMAQAGMM